MFSKNDDGGLFPLKGKNRRIITSDHQSMEWIELKRSSPVQIHEPLILIQSNPADDRESESSPVQSGHNIIGIYQIPCKIDMKTQTTMCISEDLRVELQTLELR